MLSIINRMLVVRFEDFSGHSRILVWEPTVPEGSAHAPFYAQLERMAGQFLSHRVFTRYYHEVEDILLPVKAMRAHRFVLPAWGRGIFSPVHVENLVDGVLMVARNKAAVGQVITISDGIRCQHPRVLRLLRPDARTATAPAAADRARGGPWWRSRNGRASALGRDGSERWDGPLPRPGRHLLHRKSPRTPWL